jgi:hypothetical protein
MSPIGHFMETLETPIRTRSEDVCPRCKLEIKVDARRCLHCGEHLSATSKFPLYVGIVGLLALLFVAFIMVKTIRQSDLNADTPSGDQQISQPAQPDKPLPLNK